MKAAKTVSKAASEAKKAEQLSKAASKAKKAAAADKNGSESAIGAVDDVIRIGKKVKKKLENDDDGRNEASKPERNKASKTEDGIVPMLYVTAFMFVVGALWIGLRRRRKVKSE